MLTAQINQHTTLGQFEQTLPSSFLQSSATATATMKAGMSAIASQTASHLLQGANQSPVKPGATSDKLDLDTALAGAPVAKDLTNVGHVLSTLIHGTAAQGPGQGAKATQDLTGAAAQPVPHSQGTGKVDITQLIKHDTLFPPSN